jgi:hypothetical protein
VRFRAPLQLSTDQDASAFLVQRVVVEISYNSKAADNKHNLVVAATINRNDLNAKTGALKQKRKLEENTNCFSR